MRGLRVRVEGFSGPRDNDARFKGPESRTHLLLSDAEATSRTSKMENLGFRV
jgi:hypothetical protein